MKQRLTVHWIDDCKPLLSIDIEMSGAKGNELSGETTKDLYLIIDEMSLVSKRNIVELAKIVSHQLKGVWDNSDMQNSTISELRIPKRKRRSYAIERNRTHNSQFQESKMKKKTGKNEKIKSGSQDDEFGNDNGANML